MSLAVTLLAAFGGGVFGALIGGTTAFVFTGFTALAGIAISLAGGGDTFLNSVAFGPFFGPHVAFVGSVAAMAFMGRKSSNKFDRLFRKKDAKLLAKDEIAAAVDVDDIEFKKFKEEEFVDGADALSPLFKFKDPSMLLVAGIFGVLGYLTHYLYTDILAIPIDTIALTVVTYALVSRFLFGTSGLTGVFPAGEKRFNFTGKELLFVGIWGFALAGLVGYVTVLTGMNNIGFAISAASLIYLYMGYNFPVSHHVTMVAGFAAATFGNVWLAALFGLFAAITGEYVQRAINTHVDSHIDMPATTIAIWSFIILGIFG